MRKLSGGSDFALRAVMPEALPVVRAEGDPSEPPRLSLHETQDGRYRVTVHGPDTLQDPFEDGTARHALLEVAIARTKAEALALTQAWFAGLSDDTPKGATL